MRHRNVHYYYYYMAGATWNCCHLSASSMDTIQPCTSLQCHFIWSHVYRMHVCFAITCHLDFWQNDWDILRATGRVKKTFPFLQFESPALPLACACECDLWTSLNLPRRKSTETATGYVPVNSTFLCCEPGISDGCSLFLVITSWHNAHTKQQLWLFCACTRYKK